jgi:hypothetical protein
MFSDVHFGFIVKLLIITIPVNSFKIQKSLQKTYLHIFFGTRWTHFSAFNAHTRVCRLHELRVITASEDKKQVLMCFLKGTYLHKPFT